VIETKNVDGWIFGRENDAKWTRVLFDKKWRFQNPLRQNYRHTRALAEFLMHGHSVFHSIVFFIGNCEFKTPMPCRVIKSGLAAYIHKFQSRRVDEATVANVVRDLRSLKANPTLTRRLHVAGLRSAIGD
jgi:restriction system protein